MQQLPFYSPEAMALYQGFEDALIQLGAGDDTVTIEQTHWSAAGAAGTRRSARVGAWSLTSASDAPAS